MKTLSHRITSTLAAALLLSVAGLSEAATTWSSNFSSCSGTVTTGAFAACGGVSNVTVKGVTTTGATTANATVQAWSSGLGVIKDNGDTADGPHALDNYNGMDALIFNFTQGVSLTSLQIGWNGTDNPTTIGSGTTQQKYNDSDVSLYAWLGSTAPTNFDKTSTGWTLIGDYANVGTMSSNTASVTTATYSSYWLVSGTDVGTKGTTGSIDAFKVLAVAGTTCDKSIVNGACTTTPPGEVPEPGSLALIGLGALGFVAARRRKA